MTDSTQVEGLTHLFIDDVHQEHVCQHPSCKSSRAFEYIIAEKGAMPVAQKMMRREPYRTYDRKYPYDAASKAVPLEAIQDTLGYESDFAGALEASEGAQAFRDTLSARQRFILSKLEAGYKPRDIAEMLGKKDSGSVRWQKHSIKRKAEEWFVEYE